MAHSGENTKIYKSRVNILKLLKAQNYDISKYEGYNITDIHSMHKTKQMDMLVETSEGKKAYVKYHLAKGLRAPDINEYIDDLFNLEEILTKKDDLIIIVKDEPNSSLVKTLHMIWEQEGIFVTAFNINRLQFNILEHSLVPKHRVMTEDESNQVRQKYHIQDDSELPDIDRFSPVAQAIGLRPGQMCEIIRPSRTAISSTFYRICAS